MRTVQIKKLTFLIAWVAATLLVPLFYSTGRAAAAAPYVFLNRYRIDHTYTQQNPNSSGSATTTKTDSFLLNSPSGGTLTSTKTQNGITVLTSTDTWVNIVPSDNDPTYCNVYITFTETENSQKGNYGTTTTNGTYTTSWQLVTQPRIQGVCNPTDSNGNLLDSGKPVTSDITSSIDTTKENYTLFVNSSSIQTIDGQYTWNAVPVSKLGNYAPAQEIYFESSNAISSTVCPSVFIKTGGKYLFSAPYVRSTNPNTIEQDPSSQYYQNMAASLLGFSPSTYRSCYAGADIFSHIQSSLGNVLSTSADWWSHAGTPGASFNPMPTNSLVDVSKFMGTAADLNNNITNAQTSSNVKSSASGSQSPAPSVKDDCPLPMNASMRWLGCSIFLALKDSATHLADQLNGYLYVDPNTLFSANSQVAANIFRNIGMVLIVIAGLFMIISQALGFEFLDAYTIRKLMPRLGVALVGMALAWPLLRLAVTLTNDLGGLINSVFMGLATQANSGSSHALDIGTFLGTSLIAVTATSAVVVLLGAAGFLSLLGTVILGLLIGLLVLAIRQLVIFMTVILAPLAIAAYVLPGGQKLWSFWKNTLLTTLFMYPLIMGFISAGAAMSYIMPKSNNSMQLLSIIVYFAPYFMLPFAFKLAGGLMGTVFSMAHERNKGIFEKQRKKRQAIREDRHKRAESNSLWDPNSRLQRALGGNAWASVIADPVGNIAHAGRRIPGLRKTGNRIESTISAQRTQQTGKLFEELNNMFGNNDKAYRLLSGSHAGLTADTQQKLRSANLLGKRITSLKDLQTAAGILSESEEGSERLAGNAIHNASGRLSSLYKDPEMLRADITAAGMMGLAAHGFASGDDLAYTGNLLQESMSAGAAQSMVVQAQVMGARSRPDLKAGYGIVYNGETGKFENGMTAPGAQNRAEALVLSLSPGDLAQAKTGAIEALAPTIKAMIAAGGPKAIAVQEQLFSWAGPYSQASADVKAYALGMIQQGGTPLRDAFSRYTREYDPERLAAGTPGGQEPPPPPTNTPGGQH